MRPRALRSQQPTLTAPLWFPVGAARLPVLGQGSAAPPLPNSGLMPSAQLGLQVLLGRKTFQGSYSDMAAHWCALFPSLKYCWKKNTQNQARAGWRKVKYPSRKPSGQPGSGKDTQAMTATCPKGNLFPGHFFQLYNALCIYIYMYTHTHTHIYIYTHIHMSHRITNVGKDLQDHPVQPSYVYTHTYIYTVTI